MSNKSRTKLKLFFALLLIGLTNLAVFAQSTDSAAPTVLTTNELSGSLSGSSTYYYVFDVLRDERIQVDVSVRSSDGIAFSLDLRDKAAGTLGVDGDTTYFVPTDSVPPTGSATSTGNFTATRKQKVLMALNFNGRGTYRIVFTRSGGTNDDLVAVPAPIPINTNTDVVPSTPLPRANTKKASACVDLAADTLRFNSLEDAFVPGPRLTILGTIKNVSAIDYVSGRRLQSIRLSEQRPDGSFAVVKEIQFTGLTADNEITIKHVVLNPAAAPHRYFFRLAVVYAKKLSTDSYKKTNDDCNSTNNARIESYVYTTESIKVKR